MNTTNTARLRWACRRGMLELDLILLSFFDQRYHTLPEKQQTLFERLLSEPDPILLSWFMGETLPEDASLAALVHQIRQRD